MMEDLNPRTIDALATAIGSEISGGGPAVTLLPRVAKVSGSNNTTLALAPYRADRPRLAIQNLSIKDAHVYPDNISTPSASTIKTQGIRLAPYAMLSLTDDEATSVWYGMCELEAADFRIMEVYPE